ncbi:MAG: GNAT family N-acetyltransferase [Desulfovibrio sp.]|uniref:GNAT family N-acetyltransferase n=1 Tax=Desulfovibrio sp. TaxID=885 RepID=UPI002A358D60|nr:GNAT family N-acetyltransferase [Desulfovibrio sp.]MDY0260371.1 GNAT family N-acetyltransferase [Desulfovibrio sp.]
MTEAITLRKAEACDEAAIRDCAKNAFSGYIALIGREPAPMTADFAVQIASGHIHVAVNDNGVLLGYIIFFVQDGHMHLDTVAVLPAAAGRGIGKQMITFCEDETRRLGLDAVHLYTNEKMTANLSIYPRLGYVEVDRRTDEGFSRVFFQKKLT